MLSTVVNCDMLKLVSITLTKMLFLFISNNYFCRALYMVIDGRLHLYKNLWTYFMSWNRISRTVNSLQAG